jgi:hypothetical protein
MKFSGDIKVWVDDKRACARLTADGKEGPVVVQASAPIEMVRRRVKQALEARGHEISGEQPGFDALVNGVARSTALHRLERLAPALFVPGGVATFLAIREMRRRRRARDLARLQRDAAMKPIGPGDEDDDEFEDDEDDYGDDEDMTGEEVGWRRRHKRRAGAHVGAAGQDAALAVASATPQGRAGLTLFRLARRNRRVARTVAKAQGGDPKAKAQVRVMTRQIQAAQARGPAAGLPARSTPLALLTQPLSPVSAPTSARRGLFWPWDPELVRRRGA